MDLSQHQCVALQSDRCSGLRIELRLLLIHKADSSIMYQQQVKKQF